jgi:hypothetical protein
MTTITVSSRKATGNLQSTDAVNSNSETTPEAGAAAQKRGLPEIKDQFESHRPAPLASLTNAVSSPAVPVSQAPSFLVGDLILGKGEIKTERQNSSPGAKIEPKPGPRPAPEPMLSMGIAFPGIAPKADQDVPPGSPPPEPDPIPEPEASLRGRFAGLQEGIGPQPEPLPGPDPISMGMAFQGIAPKADQDVPPGSPPPEPDPIPEPEASLRGRFAGLQEGIGPQPEPLPGPGPISQGIAAGIGLKADQDVPPSPPEPEPQPEPPNPDLIRRTILK